MRAATGWIREWGGSLYLSLAYGWLVDALVDAGHVSEAVQLFQQCVELRESNGEILGCALAARALAKAAAVGARDVPGTVTFYLDYAEDVAGKRQSRFETDSNERCRAELTADLTGTRPRRELGA